MNQRRIFLLINLTLIAVSGYCIYYLVEAPITRPLEIQEARERLEAIAAAETEYAPEDLSPSNPIRPQYPNLYNADFMDVLIELTPTPTPTPTPEPTPPRLDQIIYPWELVGMESDNVTVRDEKADEEFTLEVGGEGRRVTLSGHTATVTLQSIDWDADPPAAVFVDELGRTTTKAFE